MITAFIINIHALDNIGMIPAAITSIASAIPFYKLGIGCVVPAIIGGIIEYFIPQTQTESEVSTK